ncbi:hypothetical protein SAMN04488096_1354, partial [Mesonia phycicola]
MCPADTDAKASKLALFIIFTPNLPLAGKLYKTVTTHMIYKLQNIKNNDLESLKKDIDSGGKFILFNYR